MALEIGIVRRTTKLTEGGNRGLQAGPYPEMWPEGTRMEAPKTPTRWGREYPLPSWDGVWGPHPLPRKILACSPSKWFIFDAFWSTF